MNSEYSINMKIDRNVTGKELEYVQPPTFCLHCREYIYKAPNRKKGSGSEDRFSRESTASKNCTLCVGIIQTNIAENHNNINSNEEQFEKSYSRICLSRCCSTRAVLSTRPSIVEASDCICPGCCFQSTSATNDLSKTMITAQKRCICSEVSTPSITYQDLTLQTNDGCNRRAVQESICCQQRNRNVQASNCLELNNVYCNRSLYDLISRYNFFKLMRAYSFISCHSFRGNSTYGKFPRTMNISRAINVFYYIFLFIIITSVANAGFAGRRFSTHRGLGLRYPRQSGFRRNALESQTKRCEPITVPICSDIGYNQTDMSLSIMNKFSQHEAKEELDLYIPLMKWNCSAELKLLLCSIYTPICMKDYGHFLPPCRFVCERVRNGCLPIIRRFSYEWPNKLRCDQFPTYAGKHPMCMHFNLTRTKEEEVRLIKTDKMTDDIKTGPKSTSTSKIRSTTRKPPKPSRSRHVTATTRTTTKPKRIKPTTTSRTKKLSSRTKQEKFSKPDPEILKALPSYSPPNSSLCSCQKPMVVIKDPTDPLFNRVTTGGVPNCGVSCKSPYFTEKQINFSEMWIKWWSIVCFVVTLMTVSTFLIDMERFKYPERPIIFLSTCYMFVSTGFLIRIIAGHEAVACTYRTDHVLYHTTGPILCTTVFLLVYFFSMASALWWVILSMTWFLAAGLKWGCEAIEKYSQYYHAAAWLIPSLKTIMVLAMSSVDGDSLSGICFVGNQDVRALRGFVLAPLVVYLSLGGMFLLAGFISLFRIRSRIKKDGTKTDNLEKLMGRIGVFSVLYMVPAAALVACYFYEQKYRPIWEYSHNCKSLFKSEAVNIVAKPSFISAYDEYSFEGPITPEFIVFMVRYLMTLLIGITNGVWICSPKTLMSWKGFYRRCVCCLCGSACPPTCGKDMDKTKISTYVDPSNKNSSASAKEMNSIPRSTSTDGSKRACDSRYDSCQSRNHDLNKIEYDQNDFQINHGSRKTSSGMRIPSARCEVCDRSSRSSSNNSRNSRRKRRRRSRSRTPTENCCESENMPSRPKEMEKDESRETMVCNNTTSTDGSDRHFCENFSCIKDRPEQYYCSRNAKSSRENHFSRQSAHSSNQSKISQNGGCPSCKKHKYESSEKLIRNGQGYVINHDSLPPCTMTSYGSMASHGISSQKSATSLPISDLDEADVRTALLNPVLPNVRSNSDSPPYYHYHHHHYDGKTEI